MPMRRPDGVGRTQISLSRVRPVLRNVLRRRSLPLTREKFGSSTVAEPHDRVAREFFGLRVCKAAQIVLWSHLMSAQPRSDHRVDQGEDLKKGNIKKLRSPRRDSSARGIAEPEGRLRRAIAPLISLSSLLPVPGLAGARASTVPVALTRVRRRRTSGRPGESC